MSNETASQAASQKIPIKRNFTLVSSTRSNRWKVYPFLDSNIYEKYVGMPLAEIPAPDGNGSYDQYFLRPFFQSLEIVGVFPEVVENYNSYKLGKFAECTKLFVENKDQTREILEKVSGRQLPKKWFPWTFLDTDGTLTDGEVVNLEWPEVTFLNKSGNKVTNNMSKGEGNYLGGLIGLQNGKY